MDDKERCAANPKKKKINNQNVYDTGHIYLLINEVWGCFKIGASFDIQKRINTHKKNGFVAIDIKKDPYAFEIERCILSYIKKIGLDTGKNLFENKFDGWNECWRIDDLWVENMDELIKMSDEFNLKKTSVNGSIKKISDNRLDYRELNIGTCLNCKRKRILWLLEGRMRVCGCRLVPRPPHTRNQNRNRNRNRKKLGHGCFWS